MVDIVRVDTDTDTDGAIAGGLLGVWDGVGAIPGRWLARLQFAAEFTASAGRLAGPSTVDATGPGGSDR